MTTQEFSNEFDVLYNNIMSNLAPGLDEYEKSVFLTKAQDEIVKDYFNPKGNKYLEGFDGSKKRQIDFSTLLEFVNLSLITKGIQGSFDKRSYIFEYPKEAWIPINESITDSTNQYQVISLSYDLYTKLMSKPYKYPLKNLAWRLFNKNFIKTEEGNTKVRGIADEVKNTFLSVSNSSNKPINFTMRASSKADISTKSTILEREDYIEVIITLPLNLDSSEWLHSHLDTNPPTENFEKELILLTGPWGGFPLFTPTEEKDYYKFTIPPSTNTNKVVSEIIGIFNGPISYKVRYIKKPTPIILRDLGDDLSIENVNKETQCILPEEIHQEILLRAVELAKSAYAGDLNSSIEMGKRSE